MAPSTFVDAPYTEADLQHQVDRFPQEYGAVGQQLLDDAQSYVDGINNPDRIHHAGDFKRTAYRIGYTYNWFNADDRDIAYFNSGAKPVAAPRVDPILPVTAADEGRNFDSQTQTADYTRFDQHPQVVNQDLVTSWNHKQAPAYSASNSQDGSVYRSQLLDTRIAGLIAGGRKATLPELVGAMEDAGTVDLRAERDLPDLLAVLGPPSDPKLARAVDALRTGHADGSHRIDRTQSGTYAHAEVIAILDAWWPLLARGEFEPVLGRSLYRQLTAQPAIDDPPNAGSGHSHVGSAYDTGWFGYVDYADPTCAAAGHPGDRECFDEISFRPIGVTTVPLMLWVNRPTYQQTVEIAGHRPR